MSTIIDTAPFRNSHGKDPRGRGSWAFALERNPQMSDVWFTPGNTTFAEAKKLAKQHFPSASIIFALP